MFAAGSAMAGAHGHCVTQASNKGEMAMACHVSMANLNLTPDQKKKMETVTAEHEKAGCNSASEAKYMQEAKGILTKEQYAKFEAEAKGEKTKTKA